MKPVSPVIPDENLPEVIVAEHQDEYQNLPSIYIGEGILLCRWLMTYEEQKVVARTGIIFLILWTFGKPAPFVTMQVEKPKLVGSETDAEVDESINKENHTRFETSTHGEHTVLKWILTESDLEIISETGDVYLFMTTGGKPVTPMLVQVEEPFFEEVKLEYISSLRVTPQAEKLASDHKIEVIKGKCSECDFDVLVSAGTREIIQKHPGMKILCTVCAEGRFTEYRVLPETVSEVADVIANKITQNRKPNWG